MCLCIFYFVVGYDISFYKTNGATTFSLSESNIINSCSKSAGNRVMICGLFVYLFICFIN
jgi:hypothetical protein